MQFNGVRELFLPRRVSTQTWMMFTFAVFVGFAVVGVGLYSSLSLRGQVREAAEELGAGPHLHEAADRLAWGVA